jgi:hypothetical protein
LIAARFVNLAVSLSQYQFASHTFRTLLCKDLPLFACCGCSLSPLPPTDPRPFCAPCAYRELMRRSIQSYLHVHRGSVLYLRCALE